MICALYSIAKPFLPAKDDLQNNEETTLESEMFAWLREQKLEIPEYTRVQLYINYFPIKQPWSNPYLLNKCI